MHSEDRSSLFWDVTQRRSVVTEFTEQPTDSVFKGHTVDCLVLGLIEPGRWKWDVARNIGN